MHLSTLSTFILLSTLTLALTHTLNFSSNGTFTILQITDLHYGEGDSPDENNMKIQTELIKRVKPDVVVVTGDVISGYAYNGQPRFTEKAWEKFSKPFIETETYYAFALGNHDAQDDISPQSIYELEKANKYSLCALSQNESFENFNYYLPVYSNIKENYASSILWIFDSHSVGCGEDWNSWGCVEREQANWYEKKSKELRDQHGKDVHHLGFFHIPVPEYMTLYNNHEFYGHRNEDVSCPLINTGFFDTLKKVGDIRATFVGHDHLNDYGGWIDGIELVYGRRTGYAGYGKLAGYHRGARVIKLTEKETSEGNIRVEREHYVILEDPKYEEDITKQKELNRRKGSKQVVCVAGAGLESFLMTFWWILLGIVIVGGLGILTNRAIESYMIQRKKDYSPIRVKRVISPSSDDDASSVENDFAI